MFVSDRDLYAEIFTMDADGANQAPITDLGTGDMATDVAVTMGGTLAESSPVVSPGP